MLDSYEQQSVVQLLIYLLPACNSDTLHRLLEFLSTVADHAHDQQDKDGQEVSNRLKHPNVEPVDGYWEEITEEVIGSSLRGWILYICSRNSTSTTKILM